MTAATGTTGDGTVTDAVPATPLDIAEMTAAPLATARTSPDSDTVATALFELDHVTGRLVSTAPEASMMVALSCSVPPV